MRKGILVFSLVFLLLAGCGDAGDIDFKMKGKRKGYATNLQVVVGVVTVADTTSEGCPLYVLSLANECGLPDPVGINEACLKKSKGESRQVSWEMLPNDGPTQDLYISEVIVKDNNNSDYLQGCNWIPGQRLYRCNIKKDLDPDPTRENELRFDYQVSLTDTKGTQNPGDDTSCLLDPVIIIHN